MLEKIISGGQTGADQAGLQAAANAGIATGGWMPWGYKTLDGPNEQLAQAFNLKQHHSPDYPPRTALNVKDADATIRFLHDPLSAGEVCTLKAIKRFKKPYFDVNTDDPPPHKDLARWLIDNRVKILNVAGHSERSEPGIRDFVIKYLTEVFRLLNSRPV
jgi:Circularly permutated YpsA SLOG family